MRINKIITIMLIFIIIFYMIISIAPLGFNISYATSYQDGSLNDDINGIDDSLYPGYKNLINSLKASHSNYRILVYYTGLDWDEALLSEYQNHGTSPLNLVTVNDNYNGMWICPICGEQKYDNGSWCCTSLEGLAYMMDPRNSINDSDIFQFKDLEGGDVSYSDIQRVVSSYGSYLNNQEAIQAIVDASNQYGINGYYLVSTIVNEHGKNGSTLTAGNGYNGNYIGCYNYFNIGSYGNGTSTIINNGLSYAQSAGWNSIRNSIMGGAQKVKEKYITQYSQNTLYYQKFNVSGRATLGSHQYAQDVMAAEKRGQTLKSYYADLNSGTYTFIIPLYKNIPSNISSRPSTTTRNTITYENGVIQNVSSSLKVRSGQGTGYRTIAALNNNESVKIIRRASTAVNGYFWDLIISERTGVYGYVAREIGGDVVLRGLGTTQTTSGSVSSVDNFANSSNNQTQTQPETSTQPTVTTITHTKDLNKDIALNENAINLYPTISIEDIKEKYPSMKAIDKDGNEITTGNIGTGAKVTIDDKTYTVIKKGDTNGDGSSDIFDVIVMLNSIKQLNVLQDVYSQAACVKNNSSFDITDVILLLNYIKCTVDINL